MRCTTTCAEIHVGVRSQGFPRNLLARRLQKNIRGLLAGRGAPRKRPVKRRALEGFFLGYVVGSGKEPGGARCGGPQGALGSSLWVPRRSLGELVVGAHKEPGEARCCGSTTRLGEVVVGGPQGAWGSSLYGPIRSLGELVVGAQKEPVGARCWGPQGAWRSSLCGPTRSLRELVAGAHKEPGRACCGGPQGARGIYGLFGADVRLV